MNFQQLTYIIKVDQLRHFALAAKECHVTQPTLSMMIKKLEQELGVLIFDRTQKPIVPTSQGKKVIEQAKVILNQKNYLFELIREEKETIIGEVKIGIIPTVAPYLVPLFLQELTQKYPQLKLTIEELNTDSIIQQLRKGTIDIGLLATPLEEPNIKEWPLFYETFFVYTNKENEGQKKYIYPEEIDLDQLLLLEEGHCLRSQVLNLCQLQKKQATNFSFKSGSLETLKRLVEVNQGITILPELATKWTDKKRIIAFKAPAPQREISLVTHTSFIKNRILQCIQEEIIQQLPEKVRQNQKVNVVAI